MEKQRHYFANKGPSSQSCGFSSSHVWMWELDYKESWAPKNWFFWTVMLEKTLESPLDSKEIKPVNPKEMNPEYSQEQDAEAEALILWPPDEKNWLIEKDPDARKDWRQEEKGTTEDEMASPTHLSKLWKIVSDMEAWRVAVCGIAKSQTWLSDWKTTTQSGFSYSHQNIGNHCFNPVETVCHSLHTRNTIS